MPIIKQGEEVVKNGGFVKVWNKIVQDKRLSHQELGMLIRLMALPDTWNFSYDGFVVTYPKSRKTTVMNTINLLKEKGYIEKIERTKNSKGQFDVNVLFLRLDAFSNAENLSTMEPSDRVTPYSEKQNMEEPNTGNPLYG